MGSCEKGRRFQTEPSRMLISRSVPRLQNVEYAIILNSTLRHPPWTKGPPPRQDVHAFNIQYTSTRQQWPVILYSTHGVSTSVSYLLEDYR